MKEYEVWSEGFSATGGSSGASFHGKAIADSFDDACIQVLGSRLDRVGDELCRMSKGNYCIWACGCYDNELDARKGFG